LPLSNGDSFADILGLLNLAISEILTCFFSNSRAFD